MTRISVLTIATLTTGRALPPLLSLGLRQRDHQQVDETLHPRRQVAAGLDAQRLLRQGERAPQFMAAGFGADDLADDDLVDAADRGGDIRFTDSAHRPSPSALVESDRGEQIDANAITSKPLFLLHK
ncbi:MAG TPA: hypothetical protein VIU82_25620 [Bosea sp. (in: a-proteobacteria)]